ncbi:MAG: ABC transporter substrate-binding protein [Actinomycetota bacterium]
MPAALPIRIGLLYDYPQADDLFVRTLRFGIAESADRIDREVELVERPARGLPGGSEAEIVRTVTALIADDVLAIVGPSISDNALIAAPLCDAARLPAINYSGGERTRSEWMFHYPVGSLEEEPLLIAERLAARGLRRVAVTYDRSPVGRRYAECFEAARARLGLEVTATAGLAPLTEDAGAEVERLRAGAPDALVSLGLGVASHAVAVARRALDWAVPVVANSALMFGYARPDWREDFAGWEYVDTVADDNRMRARLAKHDRRAAGGPIGCAAYDIGRLLGEAIARCDHLTRAGLADALRSVKRLPAASGREGTRMGFGVRDHAALKGEYLVLRTWRDGRTEEV